MKIKKRHLINYSIVIPYLILSILGLIVVYSTTSANQILYGGNPFRQVISQGIFWGLSLVMILLIFHMKLDFLKRKDLMRVIVIVEIALLIISRFFSKEVNGAHGWIVIGPVSFQPAEYLKIIIVWYLSLTFARLQDDIDDYDYQALTQNRWLPRSWAELRDWRSLLLLLVSLVAIQPDLGNASIIILTAVIMVSVSGIGYRWFTIFLTSIVAGSTLVLSTIAIIGVERVSKVPIFGYVAKRFSAFFNPFKDLSDSGHQLANSYYAMSNGGWLGRGLGNSIEKNGYLPEAHTDFVFSIVIEEMGLIGAGLILALLFFLILRIFVVGAKARDPFNSMFALGVGGMILIQVFVNIGGISGLIPSTGVTFPFLSQGGNSLLVLSVAIAFVLNIDANEKLATYREMQEEYEE